MRLSLVVAMLAIVTAASAQLSLGVKGGVNMSNFTGKEVKDTKMKLGFNVGVSADYEFMPNMAIQSGLYFVTKGATLAEKEEELLGLKVKSSIALNAMYLQVPVHFAYKLDVTPGTRLVFHAGPYIAYGVGGKTKAKIKISGDIPAEFKDKINEEIKKIEGEGVNTFDKKEGIKRLDAGLGIGVGAEFGRFLVDLGWDMGLLNLSEDKNSPVRNQNAYLSVGYKF
ncbi:MAG: porin family protein [Bacteroidia bacterium]|nr:porin family protein [Bacteroidia bacterium]